MALDPKCGSDLDVEVATKPVRKGRKKWYRSKTLWLNTAFAGLTAVEASLHLMQSAVGPQAYLVLAGLVAGGNMLLRTLTTEGLEK